MRDGSCNKKFVIGVDLGHLVRLASAMMTIPAACTPPCACATATQISGSDAKTIADANSYSCEPSGASPRYGVGSFRSALTRAPPWLMASWPRSGPIRLRTEQGRPLARNDDRASLKFPANNYAWSLW